MNVAQQIHPNKIRQVLLLAIVVGMGWVLFLHMQFMLGALLGAVVLYILLRRSMLFLVAKWRWKKSWSAGLLMLISLIVIVLPFAWVADLFVERLLPKLRDGSQIENALQQIDVYLRVHYGFNLLSADNINKVSSWATEVGSSIIGSTLNTVSNVFIMYFILWFMLMKIGEVKPWLRSKLPLKRANAEKVVSEIQAMVVSNALGIPILGAVQGLVAILGYSMFGVDEPVLWGVITGIASVIPFVGTMAAWIPLTLYTFSIGETSNGWLLGCWGLFVIGSSDNIFRFILQKYMADIHPLITVFGVIVGIELFGFLGLIFGPLLIALFLLLVKIYYDEFVVNASGDDEKNPAVIDETPHVAQE